MADLELSKSDLADGTRDVPEQSNPRPPIAYSSPSAFIESVVLRIRSVLTRRFILSFISGQFVSLCITSTSVITTELVSRGWALPTTQSFFLYARLFLIRLV
jgi:solute carrier family 35, member F1/2